VIIVASKVFLFDENHWLYCSDVTYKNGIWTGWVENGAWYLHFDENSSILQAYNGRGEKTNGWKPVTESKTKLTWAGDPVGFGYNSVIEDARERYKSGEETNYILAKKKKRVKETYEDEVAF
jgi:hypothetical protein